MVNQTSVSVEEQEQYRQQLLKPGSNIVAIGWILLLGLPALLLLMILNQHHMI